MADREESSEKIPEGFTDEDLRLGRKVIKLFTTGCIVAAVICVGIAIFVFSNIPWNAVSPTPTRRGGHLPVLMSMTLPLVWFFMICPKRKHKDNHHMKRGSRITLYILGSVMIVLPVWAQIAMAEEILVAQGVISGW